jgi:hypothetical protein
MRNADISFSIPLTVLSFGSRSSRMSLLRMLSKYWISFQLLHHNEDFGNEMTNEPLLWIPQTRFVTFLSPDGLQSNEPRLVSSPCTAK